MPIFETVMLICFGMSWPMSVYKSLRTGSTKGKSPWFMGAILVGYLSGILGKLINGPVNYVVALYALNFLVVALDMGLYFVNARRERA